MSNILAVCLPVYLPVYLCLSVCLIYVCMCVCMYLSVCLSLSLCLSKDRNNFTLPYENNKLDVCYVTLYCTVHITVVGNIRITMTETESMRKKEQCECFLINPLNRRLRRSHRQLVA
jgi:hypothetical protein